MSTLARPAVLASLVTLLAACLHPALGAARWLPGHGAVVAAVLLLAVLGYVARAASAREGRLAAVLVAAGGVALVAALGADGLRGHHGTLDLAPGQASSTFDEEGPDGRSLGLRPLGFVIGAEEVRPDGAGAVTLALPGRDGGTELTARRSVAFGGYRFARPRPRVTGGASRLRVAASDGTRTEVADVAPGVPGRALDVAISLDQYFPDFALDEKQQPFSRSAEPRNPAALLTVEKGGQSYRAFVLQSMPGVHRVEPLGIVFSLLETQPERAVEIAVHREPLALVALAGGLLLVAGVALGLRRAPATAPAACGPATPLLVSGFGLLALLLLADRGAVLAWSFGLKTEAGRLPLAGVGVLLGVALVATLGGSLLLAAQVLSGEGVRKAARGALWVGVGWVAAGLLLGAVRAAQLPAGPIAGLPLLGLAGAAAVLAASLVATRPSPPPLVARAAPLVVPLAVLAAVAVALAVGLSGVWRDGTYATPAVGAAAAAAALGLAALEPAPARGPRLFAFLVALLSLASA